MFHSSSSLQPNTGSCVSVIPSLSERVGRLAALVPHARALSWISLAVATLFSLRDCVCLSGSSIFGWVYEERMQTLTAQNMQTAYFALSVFRFSEGHAMHSFRWLYHLWLHMRDRKHLGKRNGWAGDKGFSIVPMCNIMCKTGSENIILGRHSRIHPQTLWLNHSTLWLNQGTLGFIPKP